MWISISFQQDSLRGNRFLDLYTGTIPLLTPLSIFQTLLSLSLSLSLSPPCTPNLPSPVSRSLLILDPRHNNSLHPRRLPLRLPLQTNPLPNRRLPPLHLHLRPPRPPLRHRPHRRNVLLRPRLMGLPSPANAPRSLLRRIRGCRALGPRRHGARPLGIRLRDDGSGGVWRALETRGVETQGG